MSVPLHPAIVHIPLALAMLVPLGAIVIAALAWRRQPSRALVAVLVVFQGLLVGSGVVAMNAGESDEDRVEAVVPEPAIERHEERAEAFLIAGAAVLGTFAAAWALARRPGIGRAVLTVAAAGTLVVGGLALGVGSSGGELVYVHGAGAAFARAASAAPAGGGALGGERHDDD